MTHWLPWTDQAGRFSALKFVTFVLLLCPAIWMIVEWRAGWLSPKPRTDLIREDGDWTIRLLVITLAITPMRTILRWNRLVLIRRMVGLATLFYALAHFTLYCFDEDLNIRLIASEIALRIYLTIGFIALLGLVVLGVTSNEASIRRLGSVGWNRLQSLIYVIALLAIVHYFIQLRLNASWATFIAGFLLMEMIFRVLRRLKVEMGFAALLGLAIVCGLFTAGVEAAYYGLATGVNATRVLLANITLYPSFEADWFSFANGTDDVLNIRDAVLDLLSQIRPAWWVLLGGVIVALLRAARPWLSPLWESKPKPRSKPPLRAASG